MIDTALHCLGAIVIVLFAAVFPLWFTILVLNSLLWLAREWEQDPQRRWFWHWSVRKNVEWIAPAAIGAILSIALLP